MGFGQEKKNNYQGCQGQHDQMRRQSFLSTSKDQIHIEQTNSSREDHAGKVPGVVIGLRQPCKYIGRVIDQSIIPAYLCSLNSQKFRPRPANDLRRNNGQKVNYRNCQKTFPGQLFF